MSRTQMSYGYFDMLATVALAQPNDLPAFCSGNRAKHGKAIELLTRNVNRVLSEDNVVNIVKWKLGLNQVWGMLRHVDYLPRVSAKARDAQCSWLFLLGCSRSIIAQTLYFCENPFSGMDCVWDPSPVLGAGVMDCD